MLNVGPSCLFSGADPGPAAGSDAGAGSPSALWIPPTATRCDYCTADSAWGIDRGAASTGKYTNNKTTLWQSCYFGIKNINLLRVVIFLLSVLAASPVGSSRCRRTADPNPDSGSPLPHPAAGRFREESYGNHSCHIPGSRCPPASQKA